MIITSLFSALVDIFYVLGNFLSSYLQNNTMTYVATLSISVIYSKDRSYFIT